MNFDGFCNIAGYFLEEEDAEAMQQELKEAFRLYDREGNGYITTRYIIVIFINIKILFKNNCFMSLIVL